MQKISLLIFLFLISFTQFAQAATYSISPMLIEQSVVPRDGFSEMVTIRNLSSRQIRIYPTVNEIVLGSDNEIREFVAPVMSDRTTSVTSWIEVDRGRVVIMPGDAAEVEIRFRIHPNAVPGNYYAFVGFPEASKRFEGEEKVMAGIAPGVVVRLSLPQTTNQSLRLNGFSAERFIFDDSRRELTVSLLNTGDITAVPVGEIILYNARGDEVAAIPVNAAGQTIPPGANKNFELTIPETVALGKYKAFLSIDYGAGQRATIYDTVFFTVLPLWWIIITFAILLGATIMLSVWYHRRSNPPMSPIDPDVHSDVALYVRDTITSSPKDHDINLKS